MTRILTKPAPAPEPAAPLPVPELPPRVILDLATKCNLRCQMCPVWGSDDEDAIEAAKGVMDLANAKRLLDQVMAAKPLIHPALYGEPTLAPGFKEIVRDVKARGLTIAINTNGLTLHPELAEFLVAIRLDSISISIDAVTPATLKKIRGIDKLAKIEAGVTNMLRARGTGTIPRIGVSFTTQAENRHEEAAFIEKWTPIVDVVRIGHVFLDGAFQDLEAPPKRIPCNALYLTMPVHNDGTVTVCCLDGFKETNMGNVFETSVKEVWLGEKFQEVRHWHETDQYDKIPICQKCNGWVQYMFEDEVRDGLLIRRSPEFTYYNRIDRLGNWGGQLLGGHPEPSLEDLQGD
jgi:radical SAM protein with 4Fe4S-binding SPASM domain